MPDLNTDEPAAPQGLAETMAVVRATKVSMEEARKAEQERRRQTRKRIKHENAGLTSELKAQRMRENAKLRKRISRARLAAEVASLVAGISIAPAEIDRESLEYERVSFVRWLARQGQVQGAVRRLEALHPGEVMRSREILLLMRAEQEGCDPSHAAFADRLMQKTGRAWSRDQARRRLELLLRLEEPGGPWGV